MKKIWFITRNDNNWEYIADLAKEYGLTEKEQFLIHSVMYEVEHTIIIDEKEDFAMLVDSDTLTDAYVKNL